MTRSPTPRPPAAGALGLVSDIGAHRGQFARASLRAYRRGSRPVVVVLTLLLLTLALTWRAGLSWWLALLSSVALLGILMGGAAWFQWNPGRRGRLYFDEHRTVVLGVKAKRRSRIWVVDRHVKVTPEAPATELRRVVIAALAPQVRAGGVHVELRAAHPHLVEHYARDFTASGLVLERTDTAATRLPSWLVWVKERLVGVKLVCRG